MTTDEDESAALATGIEGLDPNDPDVQQLTGPPPPQPASVQDVPDAGEPLPQSSHQHVEDGYFPPGHTAPPTEPSFIPSVPPDPPASSSSQIPPQPSPQIPTKLPSQFSPPVDIPSPDVAASPGWTTSSIAAAAAATAPAISPETYPPTAPLPPSQPTIPVYSAPTPAPVPAPVPVPVPTAAFTGSHKDINKAQRHAKFAISALNFDDVPTAVQELRNALAALGTQ